jgi:hypothetical protein
LCLIRLSLSPSAYIRASMQHHDAADRDTL